VRQGELRAFIYGFAKFRRGIVISPHQREQSPLVEVKRRTCPWRAVKHCHCVREVHLALAFRGGALPEEYQAIAHVIAQRHRRLIRAFLQREPPQPGAKLSGAIGSERSHADVLHIRVLSKGRVLEHADGVIAAIDFKV
jgi:hypothetical protein